MDPQSTQHDHVEDPVLAGLLQEQEWRAQLRRYAGGAPAALISLCDVFLMEVPALLRKIQGLIDARETKGLYNAVHTLKSCLSYVAPSSDVEQTHQLELRARQIEEFTDEQLQSVSEHFEEIHLLSRRWIACVKQLLAETQSASDTTK